MQLLLDENGTLSWGDQASSVGSSVRYGVASGDLAGLRASGLVSATACLDGGLESSSYTDPRPDPAPGDGTFYLIHSVNLCGDGSWGAGRESLAALNCAAP